MDLGPANGAAAAANPSDSPPPAQVMMAGKQPDVKPEAAVNIKAPQPAALDTTPAKTNNEGRPGAAKGSALQEHDDNDDVVVQSTTPSATLNGTINGDTSATRESPQKDAPVGTLKDKEKTDKPDEKVDTSSKKEEPSARDPQKPQEQAGAKPVTQDSQPAVSITIDGRETNGDHYPGEDDRGSDRSGDVASVDGSTDDRGATPLHDGTEQGIPREDSAQSRESPAGVEAHGAEEGHDSGVDESTQAKENGQSRSPSKSSRGSPKKRPPRSSDPSPLKQRPPQSAASTDRKVPMNKVEVGKTASPNLKAVKSKIGSMDNATYRPGGGKVKIESKKLDFSKASSKISAKNVAYTPGGGDKKIESQKLKWNVSSKIGSLENKDHKPGGGDKKIESQKLVFKAQSKVGSRENIKHKPGGGDIQIEKKKLDFKDKASSKVGSLNNVQHKAGGGDKKIFDDKDYLRQVQGSPCKTPTSKASSEANLSRTQSPSPALLSPATQEEEVEKAATSGDVTPAQ